MVSDESPSPAINGGTDEIPELPMLIGLEYVQGCEIDWAQRRQKKSAVVIVALNTQDEQSINSLDHINFLNSEYNKYEDDFAMLAMFEESSETVMNFVQKVQSKLGYRIAIDRQRHSDELRKNCNIVGYKTPVAFVVNSDGQVTWAGKPIKPGLEVELKNLLGPPEIKKPSGPPATWPDEVLKHLSVPELKQILCENKVDYTGLFEKGELIEKIHNIPVHEA